MSYDNIDFLIRTEQRREEIAIAAQNRKVKEAQRAGMKLLPILNLKPFRFEPANQRSLAKTLTRGLAWLGSLFTA